MLSPEHLNQIGRVAATNIPSLSPVSMQQSCLASLYLISFNLGTYRAMYSSQSIQLHLDPILLPLVTYMTIQNTKTIQDTNQKKLISATGNYEIRTQPKNEMKKVSQLHAIFTCTTAVFHTPFKCEYIIVTK